MDHYFLKAQRILAAVVLRLLLYRRGHLTHLERAKVSIEQVIGIVILVRIHNYSSINLVMATGGTK